jgi:hypothetical protein
MPSLRRSALSTSRSASARWARSAAGTGLRSEVSSATRVPVRSAQPAIWRLTGLGSAATPVSIAVLILYQICGTPPKMGGRTWVWALISMRGSATVRICRPVPRLMYWQPTRFAACASGR